MVQAIIMISMPRTADANRDRAMLSRLSAPPIGTVIDSLVFMRIDVAAAWRAISSSSSWNCRRSGKRDTNGKEREREIGRKKKKQWLARHTPHIRRRGVRPFQFPAVRNRRARPVQSYRYTTGWSWSDSFKSAPHDGEVSRAKHHFSSGRVSLETSPTW